MTGASLAARAAGLSVALGLWLATCLPGAAAGESFPPDHIAKAFPGAERVEPAEGNPPSAPVFRAGELAGYLFSTRQITGSTGYSGKPLDLLVGLDLTGRIAGVSVLEQHEPILVIGIRPEDFDRFVLQYAGLDIRAPVRLAGTGAGRDLPRQVGGMAEAAPVSLDGIAGASISSVVFNDAILRSARIVAQVRGILPPEAGTKDGGARVDFESFEKRNWPGLLREGAIARLQLNVDAVDAAFAAEKLKPWSRAGHDDDKFAPRGDTLFIDLFAALATPARIGRNILGDLEFNRAMARLAPGDQMILIAANGLYSFKGTGFARSGTFDRIAIIEEDKTIPLGADRYIPIENLAIEGAPQFREAALFVLPAGSGFDPARPWRLQLVVGAAEAGERHEEDEAGGRFVTFDLPYRLPGSFIIERAAGPQAAAIPFAAGNSAENEPLWIEVWEAHPLKIAVLMVALLIMTTALIFQDWIERRPRFYKIFRLSFLTFTFLWIGIYAGAQLSVFNVITFVQAVLTGFRWDFFLLAPLVFILWSFVAITLIFWGRGIFCGWLCPFGALQELLNTAARALRIPQLPVPFALQERLWMIKYVVFLALLGLSFYSVPLALFGSEIEPFKTAISLKFMRAWPFVAYAAALLAAGLFVERFFCRYLCPLGAALAIPARLRMFEWLKRRPQCGTECHICAVRCTVGAIHPDGHINLNECVYCFNCQILYYDAHVCPPMIARRKRRELRARIGNWQQTSEESAGGSEQNAGQ